MTRHARALALILPLALAQPQPARAADAATCSPATLSGTYLFAFSGVDLAGGSSTLFAVAGYEVYDGAGRMRSVVTTNAAGKLARNVRQPGAYTVAADCAGTVTCASRGLGHPMAAQFLKKGWYIVGTVRGGGTRTRLHDLADESPGRVEIEILDIREPDQLAALRGRLSGRLFDMLFVYAGTTNNEKETIAEVTTDEFVRVMITNALSPMRAIESLKPFVTPTAAHHGIATRVSVSLAS